MHKYAQMTVLFPTPLLKRGVIFLFPCSLARTTYEVYHPCCLSYHGEFLGVLSSNIEIFQSVRRSPTFEQCGAINALYLVTLDIEILGVVDNSIYLLLFYNLFKVHPGSCAHARFNHGRCVAGWSTFIIVIFSERQLLRSVGEVDHPPFCLLARMAQSASAHYFLFLQDVYQHLGCLLSLASHQCPIWTFT